MRLAIAIFGLVTSLSAQVICQPVDYNSRVDIASLDSAMILKIDTNWPPNVNKYLVTDYPTRKVRCFEHLQGTIDLGHGKIVHSTWMESTPLEQWMYDASSCSLSRSKEPLFTFIKGINESNAQAPKTVSLSIPVEFCAAVDR